MNVPRTFEVLSVDFHKKGEVRVTAEGPAKSILVFFTTSKSAPRVEQRLRVNISWEGDQP